MQNQTPVLDTPVLDAEFEDNLTNFPSRLVLIDLGDGKYAANNAITPAPDAMEVNGIACFINAEEAIIYQEDTKIGGTLVRKSFSQARDIALSKINIQAIFLMQGTHVIEIHFVR